MRALAALALAALCLALAGRASAQKKEGVYDKLGLSFQVESDLVPQHLCVLAQQIVDSAGRDDVARLEQLAELAGGPDGVYRVERAPAAPAAARKVLRALDDMLENAKLGEVTACKAGAAPGSRTCTGELVPGTPPTHHLMCTSNNQPGSAAPGALRRVAVVRLNWAADTSPLSVETIELDGSTAVVRLKPPSDPKTTKVVIATVIGGDYRPGTGQLSAGQNVVLPLLPRCVRHALGHAPVPSSSAREACAVASAGTERLEQRVTLGGASTLWIPYTFDPGSKSLTVSSGQDASRDRLELRAEWHEASPPRTIALRASALSFTWRRHCLLPASAGCPIASLPEAGVDCLGEPDGEVCRYQCPAPDPAAPARGERPAAPGPAAVKSPAVGLPAKVLFRIADVAEGREDRWDDVIFFPGQALAGYLPADERHITVGFEKWTAGAALRRGPERIFYVQPGERIEYVEVRAPGGETYRVVPRSGTVVLRMPNVGCHDYVSYRIVGDQAYREVARKLEGGRLPLDHPRDSLADLVTLGLAVGAGFYGPVEYEGEAPQRPHAIVEGVVLVRTRALLSLLPDVELRSGVLLTQQWYRTEPRASDDLAPPPASTSDPVWYVRAPVTLNLVVPAPIIEDSLYFGLGAGVVIGWPMLAEDQRRAIVQGRLTGNAYAGYRLGRSVVAIEAGARFIAGETTYAYGFDYRGAPDVATESGLPLFGELRLRFGR